MPEHLTRIQSYATGATPDPAALEVGYPVLIEGQLHVVNAAQDGFDPAVSLVTPLTASSAATYAASATDRVVALDATSQAITVDLPASPPEGRIITVKKADASANAVTVQTPGAELIDGAATVDLTAAWGSATFVFGGTDWLQL